MEVFLNARIERIGKNEDKKRRKLISNLTLKIVYAVENSWSMIRKINQATWQKLEWIVWHKKASTEDSLM